MQKIPGRPRFAVETLEIRAKVVAPSELPSPHLVTAVVMVILAVVMIILAMMTMTAPAMGETAGGDPAVASMRGSLR